MMVWDYLNDVAVEESKMKLGSKRWKASEKARMSRHANVVEPWGRIVER